MSDRERRQHERRADEDDRQAEARVLVSRLRAGDLRRLDLELAAYLGDVAAAEALGAAAPPVPADVFEWARGFGRFGADVSVRAGLALARREAEPRPGAHRAPLRAAESWLACPCRMHSLAAYELRHLPGLSPIVSRLTQCFDGVRANMTLVILDACQSLGEEVVRGAIREALVPDALGPAGCPAWHFDAVSASLVHDDIARRRVNAIANAANDQLLMQGGVAAALRAAAGAEVERQARAHAPAPLGSVVRTEAGTLGARWIYHAVVIRYSLVGGTRASDVRVAVRGVVAQAKAEYLSTLAMPLFGAGVGGLGVAESVETILDALEAFPTSWECNRLHVEVVVSGTEEYAEAVQAWGSYLPAAAREEEAERAAERYLRLLEAGEAGFDVVGDVS